ncbi:MAG TPA: cytochrome D1 domain-containing protein [Methylophilus sp.]
MKIRSIGLGLALSLLATSQGYADAGLAYVTSQDGGVTVVDLATMTPTGSIDVKGAGPRGLGVTEDGKWLIVATRENGSISVVDTATRQVVKQIPVGKNPEFVRVKGRYAYVSYEPSAKGGPPPKPGAAPVEEDDDDDKEPARIGIVDLKLGKKVREIIGGPETEGVEFSKDGKLLVITNEADNTITVHNLKTGKLVKKVETHSYGDRPRGIKVSPDGKTYVTTLEYGNKFLVMDQKFNVVKTVDTAATPYGIAYDKSGKYLYVASNKDKLLQVFDAHSFDKVKDIPTGNRCWHFSFTPDDKDILLACGKSDALFVIDVEKQEVKQQVEIKNMPWGLVTFPKAMGSLDNP